MNLLILGCGYTGQRVAKRFLARGARVIATTRNPARLAGVGAKIIRTIDVPEVVSPGMLVLHSIPPGGPAHLVAHLHGFAARVVYLSSTAVYGSATLVNENTPVDGATERAQLRLAAEDAVARGPWSSLILRPAGIYGPGRGVQESIQRGEHSLSDTFVSRIHVDDLAAHAEAALISGLEGAYPVADEEPCTSLDIAKFCAGLLNIPRQNPILRPSQRIARFASNRRVDGSAIRMALGLTLTYPSYRVGIPASLPA